MSQIASLPGLILMQVFIFTSNCSDFPEICSGNIKVTTSEYFYSDNGTTNLRVAMDVNFELAALQRTCFQLVAGVGNASSVPLVYTVEFLNFEHVYPIRKAYEFGIPELQSECRCDCPGGREICTATYNQKQCAGELCVTRYHTETSSLGCDQSGAATMCCDITIKPFEGRRYCAINLGHPTSEATLGIKMYMLRNKTWRIVRSYTRKILANKRAMLRLNGFENYMMVDLFAQTSTELPLLNTVADKFYVAKSIPATELFDYGTVNGLYEFDIQKLGWLRIQNLIWSTYQPWIAVPSVHRPIVRNCKDQTYTDQFNIYTPTFVVRNITGSRSVVSLDSKTGVLEDMSTELEKLLVEASFVRVTYRPASSPILQLKMKMRQNLTISSLVHANIIQDFRAEIRLDRNGNTYLNLTLTGARGQFLVDVCPEKGSGSSLSLLVVGSSNKDEVQIEFLALPPHFTSYACDVCVHSSEDGTKLCEMAPFTAETVPWFTIPDTSIPNRGSCAGCNDMASDSFWSNLDPRRWLNGFNSVSEGVAFAVEITIGFLVFIVAIILWRKLFWPALKWALCTTTPQKPLT